MGAAGNLYCVSGVIRRSLGNKITITVRLCNGTSVSIKAADSTVSDSNGSLIYV